MDVTISEVSTGDTLDEALTKLCAEVREGVKHGFFKYTIKCEVVKGSKRRLQIGAGKNYQFTFPETEQ